MANVLKKNAAAERADAARDVAGLAGFNLDDLAKEGRHRLDECRRQVRDMLDQAKLEAEAIRADAKKEGYEQGFAQANVDAEQRIMEQAEVLAREGLQRLHQAVSQLHEVHDGWMRQYSDSLSDLAIAAAERVVQRKLADDRGLLVRWAEDAVHSTRSANQLTLAVHPETLAELGGALDQLLAGPGLPEQTRVEPDESVDRNSVIVRQPGGEIRAGLNAQLVRLRELLA